MRTRPASPLPAYRVLLALGALAACGETASDGAGGSSGGGQGGDTPGPPTVGGLRIEEVFFTGSPGLVEHTFNDQFIDVRNDSDGLVFVDGLLVGDAFGAAGEINPGQPTSPFSSDGNYVYLANLFRIPGDGDDVAMLPGETLTIAHDGTNHQPDSTLDLGNADFEAYIESSGNDDDWPNVPNLEVLHFTGGHDWLMPVFGPAVVLARVDDPDALERVEHPDFPELGPLVKVPVGAIVDGVEALMDAESVAYKRLPSSVDAGFTFVGETYVGRSVRRRRHAEGAQLLFDDDDSTTDFEVAATPAPGE